jgi:hypothetical protein
MGSSICPPPYVSAARHSRQYVSSPVSFVTIVKPTAHADADVPLVCPVPFRWIMVVSCRLANILDSMFLHFQPLNFQGRYGTGLQVNMVGDENWLPLCVPNGNKSKIGMGYIFEEEMPPTTLFLDIGQDSGGGGGVQITFALSRHMKYWNLLTSQ